MCPKDLKNEFDRVFGAKIFGVAGELTGNISWTHGPMKYLFGHNRVADIWNDYVSETSLYYLNEHTKKFKLLDEKQWNPQDTVKQVVLWVTEIILNRDAAT